MTCTLALEHVDPFGKPDLGLCYACGEAITRKDRRLVRVSVRKSEALLLHEPASSTTWPACGCSTPSS